MQGLILGGRGPWDCFLPTLLPPPPLKITEDGVLCWHQRKQGLKALFIGCFVLVSIMKFSLCSNIWVTTSLCLSVWSLEAYLYFDRWVVSSLSLWVKLVPGWVEPDGRHLYITNRGIVWSEDLSFIPSTASTWFAVCWQGVVFGWE